jgi:hypothetical protein
VHCTRWSIENQIDLGPERRQRKNIYHVWRATHYPCTSSFVCSAIDCNLEVSNAPKSICWVQLIKTKSRDGVWWIIYFLCSWCEPNVCCIIDESFISCVKSKLLSSAVVTSYTDLGTKFCSGSHFSEEVPWSQEQTSIRIFSTIYNITNRHMKTVNFYLVSKFLIFKSCMGVVIITSLNLLLSHLAVHAAFDQGLTRFLGSICLHAFRADLWMEESKHNNYGALEDRSVSSLGINDAHL